MYCVHGLDDDVWCGAGYPPDQAVEVALRTVREYLEQNHEKVCIISLLVFFLAIVVIVQRETHRGKQMVAA